MKQNSPIIIDIAFSELFLIYYQNENVIDIVQCIIFYIV